MEDILKDVDYLRLAFDNASIGICIVACDGKIVKVNRYMSTIFGYAEDELEDMTVNDLAHPEDRHISPSFIDWAMTGEVTSSRFEKRYFHKNGNVIWGQVDSSLVRDGHGHPICFISHVQDITERKALEEQIREMSFRDHLTGLYNRRGFITLAEQQLKAAGRAERQLLLFYIDADDMKMVNDAWGHEEGDRVLISTAEVIGETFRESDIIARIGGDEFSVLAIDVTDMHSEIYTNRLQQKIDVFNAKRSRRFTLSMSWGFAFFDPLAPKSLDELLSSADKMMYERKKNKPPPDNV